MDLNFCSVPNHHQEQKSSGRYRLLWHWVMLHGKWEKALSVSIIIFFEPWNWKQWLSLNAFMDLLKISLVYWLFIACPPCLQYWCKKILCDIINKNLAYHIGLILLNSPFGDSEPKREGISSKIDRLAAIYTSKFK